MVMEVSDTLSQYTKREMENSCLMKFPEFESLGSLVVSFLLFATAAGIGQLSLSISVSVQARQVLN